MRHAPRSIALLFTIGLLLLTTPAWSQVNVRTRRPAGEEDWTANAVDYQSVVLQIDSDGNPNYSDSRISAQTVVALAQSTVITDPSIEKALGLKASDARSTVSINAQVSGNRFIQLTVTIKPGAEGVKPGASALLIKELCDRIQAAAAQSADAQARVADQKKASIEKEVATAQAKWEKASAALKAARASNPNMVNDGTNPRYQISNLQQQKQQLELSLAGQRARIKSMTEDAPARTPTTAPSASGGSEAWDRLIAIRQKVLDDTNARLEKKEATPADVANAEAMLADARAMSAAMQSLSAARMMPIGYARGDGFDLPSLKAAVAESEARLEILNKQIAQIPAANDPTVSYEEINRLQSEEQRARNELDQAQQPLNDLRRNNRTGGTFVLTVLDGSAAPKTEK